MFRSRFSGVVLAGMGAVACHGGSFGDISGPNQAKVGETVEIHGEGRLHTAVGDVTMLSLLGYDAGHVLGDLVITDVKLEGATELPDQEEPATWDDGRAESNVVYVRQDEGVAHYRLTAEVTCVEAGEVKDDKRPSVLYGLQWDYDDGDSGGVLNRFGDALDFPFTCTD